MIIPIIFHRLRPAFLGVIFSASRVVMAVVNALISWRDLPVSMPQAVIPMPSVDKNPDALAELHMFGAAPEGLQKTRLALMLQGILLLDEAKQSLAIIAEGQEEAVVYRVGDRLKNGAVLTHITNEFVVINYQGHLEQLPIRESEEE